MLLQLSLHIQGHAFGAPGRAGPGRLRVQRRGSQPRESRAGTEGNRQSREGLQVDAPTRGRQPAAPYGRKPTGRGAASGRQPPHPQAADYRLQRAPDDRAHATDRAVLAAPGILSPRKDHRQGRARGRVACGDGASATLDTDLPRQLPAPVGRTGQTRLGVPFNRAYQEDGAEPSHLVPQTGEPGRPHIRALKPGTEISRAGAGGSFA